MQLCCERAPSRRRIEAAIAQCEKCQSEKTLLPKTAIGKIPMPDRPGMSIAIDHFSPFGTKTDVRGYSTCLTIKDRFSKAVMCVPCYTHSHEEVTYHLGLYMQLNGVPRHVKMDNFFADSQIMAEFLEENGIVAHFSPAYHPASNGDVEIVHRQFRKLIPLILENSHIQPTHWADACHAAALFVNTTPHSGHGFAPLQLHRGYLAGEIFRQGVIPKEVKQQWEQAKQNLERKSDARIRMSKRWTILPAGTKIWLFLGENTRTRKKVPAVVVTDSGQTVIAEKCEKQQNGRYQQIPMHKSQISLRFEDK